MAALILFHTQQGQQAGGPALQTHLHAESPNGNWDADTNACGDFPATLAPGHYDVTINAPGYQARTIPMDLADCGIVTIGLDRAISPFPPIPSRDQVCRVRIPFQGFTAQTAEFSAIPMFGPETSSLNDADLLNYFAQIKTFGFTHCEFAVSWQYDEKDYQYPVPGRDLSQNLPELCRRIDLAIRSGLLVGLFLAGDGRSAPQNPDGSYPYNDPQGWTYGCEWLMANLERIITALKTWPGGDLTPYMFFSPGYDGVFYGWGNTGQPDLQPQRVGDFGTLFRSLLPDGYLALEHTTGTLPLGEGGTDFGPGGKMQVFDIVLSEFQNWPLTGDPTWQIAGRLLGPKYVRPPDQPAGDDPHPPFVLAGGTARGPYYAIPYEYATYPWVRAELTADQVQQGRAYYGALGYPDVC